MSLDNNKKKQQPENEKQTLFERLYWVVFQFFMKIYYAIMQDKIILFDAALLIQRTTMQADDVERSIK